MLFKMVVHEIFHLQSGHTVFAGPVETAQLPVKKFQAELIVEGQLPRPLTITGEFLMDKKHPKGFRAISTLDPIDLDRELIQKHRVVIHAKPDQNMA